MRILEQALTFDDVLLVPAYSEVLPREVDLSSQLTRGIRVNLPFVSAAMDTVTEARLAITIAQEGGIGIVHKNMTIEGQAREVLRVKKFESGVISDPITITPDRTIREVLDLTRAKGISGVPVVVGGKAVGIVTHRDLRFVTELDKPVSAVMTPQEQLITVRENAPKDEVLARCASARRWAPARTPLIASRPCVRRAWTWSSSIRRMVTRAACSRWSGASRRPGRTSRSSAAIS
jgi:IMP dehydrogenase